MPAKALKLPTTSRKLEAGNPPISPAPRRGSPQTVTYPEILRAAKAPLVELTSTIALKPGATAAPNDGLPQPTTVPLLSSATKAASPVTDVSSPLPKILAGFRVAT